VCRLAALNPWAGGGRYVAPELAADGVRVGDSPLTPREADVLELAAGGAPVDEIAKRAALTSGHSPQLPLDGIEPFRIWAYQPKMMMGMGRFNQAVRKGLTASTPRSGSARRVSATVWSASRQTSPTLNRHRSASPDPRPSPARRPSSVDLPERAVLAARRLPTASTGGRPLRRGILRAAAQ
jgi:hypothetical protein